MYRYFFIFVKENNLKDKAYKLFYKKYSEINKINKYQNHQISNYLCFLFNYKFLC